MSTRDYNKLYVNTNRSEGSEKILLGYQNDARDTFLKKDVETYFHIPSYTKPISLLESSLITDGATGGPFPAASDRILKDRRNYGNVTASGNPSDVADGTWFCSWLYKDELGNMRWMDRFYNPGTLVYSIASQQLSEGPRYVKNNPIFRDVPSKMVFDPGVLYKYFHMGEKTAQQLVTTFGGVSGERILMNLDNWNGDNKPVDSSSYDLSVMVVTNASNTELYPTMESPERVTKPVISFDNNKDTAVSVDFLNSFNLTEEFTVAFWAQSESWHESQTTQLVGNYSAKGGYGLFLQNLSSYPFFVIPETGYGHLLYVNEEPNGFLDKSAQLTYSVSATPEFIAIDMDSNLIVANNDGTSNITKYNNTGKVIATTLLNNPSFVYQTDEKPIQLICGANDEVNVITNKNIYTFDTYLMLRQTVPRTSTTTTVATYQYNIISGSSELLLIDDMYDVKYIEQQQWSLSATDGNLYRKSVGSTTSQLFAEFLGKATKLAIDPLNRIWVMHDNNAISIFDSKQQPFTAPLATVYTGKNFSHDAKNINFMCVYNRTTQSREWRAVIYYSDKIDGDRDLNVYVLDIDGNLLETLTFNSLFNSTTVKLLNENTELFEFFGKGDFTGYEHKRVFGSLSPYKNQTQLVLRTSLKDKTKPDLTYKQFKVLTSINDWDKNSWQHITLTLKNRVFTVYVNGQNVLTQPYGGEYELSYELKPPFYIGTPVGSQSGFNKEIGYCSSIFNGLFEDIKMYNYALIPNTSELFVRASTYAQDIYWSLPIPSIQYVEKVERMFKHKFPGAKAPFYSIKISGSYITDPQTRSIIEEQIREIVSKLQPAYVDLLEVYWVD